MHFKSYICVQNNVKLTNGFSTKKTKNKMKTKLLIFSILLCKIVTAQNITANFTGWSVGCAPFCVNFSDLSTSSNGAIVSWHWIFSGANPSTSTLQNPYVCFSTPGSYDVSLSVVNANGDKDTLALSGYVTVFPFAIADFTYTPSGNTVSCTNAWSSNVVNWFWDFGDGSALDNVNTNPVHTYSVAGSYNICLSVINQHGCKDTICKSLIVLGVEDYYLPSLINISPNPFSMQATMQTSNVHKNATLTVYNSFGQQVKEIKNISGQTVILSRENLASGLYFVLLSDESKTITIDKLVIIDK